MWHGLKQTPFADNNWICYKQLKTGFMLWIQREIVSSTEITLPTMSHAVKRTPFVYNKNVIYAMNLRCFNGKLFHWLK